MAQGQERDPGPGPGDAAKGGGASLGYGPRAMNIYMPKTKRKSPMFSSFRTAEPVLAMLDDCGDHGNASLDALLHVVCLANYPIIIILS